MISKEKAIDIFVHINYSQIENIKILLLWMMFYLECDICIITK